MKEFITNDTIVIITTTSYFIFLFDVGIHFVTAYYSHGALVKKKLKIASNYYKNYFIYDMIAVYNYQYLDNCIHF